MRHALSPKHPVSSYLAFSPLPTCGRRLFSVTLLHTREWLPVRKYDALRCPDFPHPAHYAESDKTRYCHYCSYFYAKIRTFTQFPTLFCLFLLHLASQRLHYLQCPCNFVMFLSLIFFCISLPLNHQTLNIC